MSPTDSLNTFNHSATSITIVTSRNRRSIKEENKIMSSSTERIYKYEKFHEYFQAHNKYLTWENVNIS